MPNDECRMTKQRAGPQFIIGISAFCCVRLVFVILLTPGPQPAQYKTKTNKSDAPGGASLPGTNFPAIGDPCLSRWLSFVISLPACSQIGDPRCIFINTGPSAR
jgi:hypothetical protein